MYLLFWIPHPGQAIPVYEDWVRALSQGGLVQQVILAVALSGLILFSLQHVRLLVWNLQRYAQWRNSPCAAKLLGSNAHTQLLAIPLTLAMSINVLFVLGALLVPGLWNIVEYLFPLAMLGFAVLGVWAMRIYLHFFSHSVALKPVPIIHWHNYFQPLPLPWSVWGWLLRRP